jgi:hypothetical protein
MSASYWLFLDGTLTGNESVQVWDDGNITYNLGKMLRAAGFPSWDALIGAPAAETGGMLRKVAETLRADPERFREFNPPNGWGDYEGAIGWCERFAAACARYPRATIGGSL